MNSGPGIGAISVTPNDTADIAATRGIYIGAAGDLKVKMFDGSIATFTSLAAGVVHPISVTRVYATGTTATGILTVY